MLALELGGSGEVGMVRAAKRCPWKGDGSNETKMAPFLLMIH